MFNEHTKMSDIPPEAFLINSGIADAVHFAKPPTPETSGSKSAEIKTKTTTKPISKNTHFSQENKTMETRQELTAEAEKLKAEIAFRKDPHFDEFMHAATGDIVQAMAMYEAFIRNNGEAGICHSSMIK